MKVPFGNSNAVVEYFQGNGKEQAFTWNWFRLINSAASEVYSMYLFHIMKYAGVLQLQM
jgi:hypothetical protein